MRLLDLFSGVGGFSLAARLMGWDTVAFVEKDPFCQKILRKNFGEGIYIHNDITSFSGTPFQGHADIITGGFPCQPFSFAGQRKGREDEQHLFPQMLRVISEVRPQWVIAENVRGLLSIESGQLFSEIVSSLESTGYEVITFCIPASAVGAPHRRDRVWIIGCSYESATSDSNSTECEGTVSSRTEWWGSGDRNGNAWIEAATRFCRVDDGIPSELDISGSRDNRTNRLRVLGNSIVPQIAFEIFKAIEQAENKCRRKK